MYGSSEDAHFFEVKLELFDGPIDLLLHLVKQRELPIERVSLAQVTEQYLSCIEAARQFDLEVAGEYLVIAATLLSIKSSVLLDQPIELEEDDDGNMVDPHQELLRKLREAEVYKYGAQQLATRNILGIDVFSGPSLLEDFEAPDVGLKKHDPLLLGRAFRKLLERAGKTINMTISVDSISVVQRMMTVLDKLRLANGPVLFEDLLGDLKTRAEIISSFIALLELSKRQAIVLRQDQVFDRIYLALASDGQMEGELDSEFDHPELDREAEVGVANA